MTKLMAQSVTEKYKRIEILTVGLPRTDGLAKYFFNLTKAF